MEFTGPNRGPEIAAYQYVMIIVPTVSVALRMWSRVLSDSEKHGKIGWDDYTVIAALPFSIATNGLAIGMVKLGLGRHIIDIPPENITPALRLLFAAYLTFDTALTLAKSSALLFYARIFEKTSNLFVRTLWITQIMVWAWWFGIVFGTIFMCSPVHFQWDKAVPGHCGSTGSLWIGSAIPSVIIDVIILLIPMPMIWRLHLQPLRKFLLAIIFICGYGVVVISIGRLITVTRDEDKLNKDLTWEGVDALYWLAIEVPVTIMSVCLPSLFFLYRRIKQYGPMSLFTSRSNESRIHLRSFSASRTAKSDERDSSKRSQSSGDLEDGVGFAMPKSHVGYTQTTIASAHVPQSMNDVGTGITKTSDVEVSRDSLPR